MIQAKSFHMRVRFTGIGPGGWNCNCCGPAPKHRKSYCRAKKRGDEKKYYDKYIRDALKDNY